MAVKKVKSGEPAEAPEASSAVSVKGKLEEFKEFFEQSKVEIKKVTWPTRKETVTTSVAVMVLVVVMTIFLGIVDATLTRIVRFILS